MQYAVKVKGEGEITMPQEVQRTLGVEEGDTIVFETDEAGVHLRTDQPSVFAKYKGAWRDGEGQTLDQILAEIREMRGDLP